MFSLSDSAFQIQSVFYIIGVPAFAVAGNHFPDKTGEEKLGADDYGCEREVEQGLLGNRPEIHALHLVADLDDYQAYHHDASNQEQQRAYEPEKMHWLAAEGHQEP